MWPHPFIYILSVTAFALQWQSGVVVTIAAETRWTHKGKNISCLALYRRSLAASGLCQRKLYLKLSTFN